MTKLLRPAIQDSNIRVTGYQVPNSYSNMWDELQQHVNGYLEKVIEEDNYNAGIEAQTQAGTKQVKKTNLTLAGRSYNRGAQDVYAMNKENELDNTINDLTIKYQNDPVGFQKAREAAKKTFIDGADSTMLSQLGLMFDKRANRLKSSLELGALQHKKDTDRADVVTRMNTLRSNIYTGITSGAIGKTEDGVKSYLAPSGQYVDELMVNYPSLIQTFVDLGGTPDQARKYSEDLSQTVREAEWMRGYTGQRSIEAKAAYIEMVDTFNKEAVTKSNGMRGTLLSPERREAVVRKMSADLKQELSLRNARKREVKSMVDSAVRVLNKGGTPPNIDAVRSVAGEFGDLSVKLNIAENNNDHINDLIRSPIENIEAFVGGLRDMKRNGVITEDKLDLLDTAEGLLEDRQKAIESGDLLGHAAEYGIVQLPAFNLANPDTWADQKQARNVAAGLFGQTYQTEDDGIKTIHLEDVDVAPLSVQQMEDITRQWEGATTDEKMLMVSGLQTFTGNQKDLNTVLKSIAPKAPELATVVGLNSTVDMTGNGQAKTTARLVLTGAEYLAANPKAITEKNAVESHILSQLQEVFPSWADGTPRGTKSLQTMTSAAFNTYVALMVQNGDVSEDLDKGTAEEAITMVLGLRRGEDVTFPKINGHKTLPFAYGMKSNRMKQIWNTLTEEDFDLMGGVPVAQMGSTLSEVPFEEIKKKARLVPLSTGRYALGMPNKYKPDDVFFLVNPETRKPFVFDYSVIRGE